MSKSIGVGVIGCGEIAQLMHLPFLKELPQFHIAALCDISANTVTALADHYGVAGRYTDHHALLADAGVDAVVICTYDHGAIAADAIRAGKHMIVEKPVAFTPSEARSLVDMAEKSGLVALVGYMKFYDPGYEAGVAKIRSIGKPKSIHVHDFAGRFDTYQRFYTQFRFKDSPQQVIAETRENSNKRIEAALGESHAGYRDLYLTLLGLSSHDLGVMRGAFGSPSGVSYARETGPNQLLAILDYDGTPCIFDMAISKYEWWDEWIHVHGERDEVRIEFQNPYYRQASANVLVKEAEGDTWAETRIPGGADTSFRREWQHFADCILNGAAPRTPLSGGLADLDLAVAIIHAMPPKPAG